MLQNSIGNNEGYSLLCDYEHECTNESSYSSVAKADACLFITARSLENQKNRGLGRWGTDSEPFLGDDGCVCDSVCMRLS